MIRGRKHVIWNMQPEEGIKEILIMMNVPNPTEIHHKSYLDFEKS